MKSLQGSVVKAHYRTNMGSSFLYLGLSVQILRPSGVEVAHLGKVGGGNLLLITIFL